MNTSPTSSYTVLLVEDRRADVALAKHALANLPFASFEVMHAGNLAQAVTHLKRGLVDLALVDLSLPDSSGIDTFNAIRAADPNVAIVILTGMDDEDLALAMLKQGAQDYLLKDEIKTQMLGRSLRYAIERQRSAAVQKLNEQLKKTQKTLTTTIVRLEQANEELAQYTCFFSHDLQEPLRKVTYFAKLLEEDAGKELNEQARQDVDFMTDAARRMQGLVNALITLSRTGQAQMDLGSVNLKDCVAEALGCLTARIDETRAEIRCDSLPTVFGDIAMLSHLYQNLIGNALKYTSDQKTLIELTAEQSDKYWILGVRDNGIGIDPKMAERIFAPFQRLNTDKRHEGSGVGLACCRKVVERHGGRIWVESTPGKGTHFKFTLPARKMRPESATKDHEELSDHLVAAGVR